MFLPSDGVAFETREVCTSRCKRSSTTLVSRTAIQLHPSGNDWEKDLGIGRLQHKSALVFKFSN